jgi:hypothetical protein
VQRRIKNRSKGKLFFLSEDIALQTAAVSYVFTPFGLRIFGKMVLLGIFGPNNEEIIGKFRKCLMWS